VVLQCDCLLHVTGVHSVAYAFPKVHLVTTAVDPEINDQFYILPGIGKYLFMCPPSANLLHNSYCGYFDMAVKSG